MFIDNKIFVESGNGPLLNAKRALSALDLSKIKNKKVLIKPNIGRLVAPEKGINTHPQAIAGVIEALKDAGIKKIAIGESPILGVNTMEAFKKSGVTEVAQKYNCELIDMDSIPPREVKIKNGRVLDTTSICSHVFEYDILLSLPVAKCHMHTGVTLGIKNLKGCLYKREKVRYHQLEYKGVEYPEKTLDSAISDLATVLMPHITVIDGYIGMQGLGPSGGDPIKSDFAVASYNAFGADITGCVLMGFNPQEIPHLKIISERMDFSFDFNEYQINPVDFRKFRVNYKQPANDVAIEYPDVVLCDKESCSACLSTVMLFLKRFKDDMSQYLLDDGLLHLAIGKGVTKDDIKEGTVLIGNCTKLAKDFGIYVPGCPPVPTRIYKAITGREPDKNEPEIES
ncbi:MAG: DUF362 domain-containing protein [Spirochaetes bacterium]|nr:DUF362 domain-containing protein [Spirochaetota bacterium]